MEFSIVRGKCCSTVEEIQKLIKKLEYHNEQMHYSFSFDENNPNVILVNADFGHLPLLQLPTGAYFNGDPYMYCVFGFVGVIYNEKSYIIYSL